MRKCGKGLILTDVLQKSNDVGWRWQKFKARDLVCANSVFIDCMILGEPFHLAR